MAYPRVDEILSTTLQNYRDEMIDKWILSI